MKRLDKGENYYYISIPYWKVCHTQDWYFGTDNERFKAGNYFADSSDARECFGAITEQFGEELDKLKAKAKKNDTTLIKAVRDISDKAKSGLDIAPERLVKQYVEATDSYQRTAREINKAVNTIHAQINEIIKEAGK